MPDYIRVSEATEATDAQMTDTALMDVAIVNSSSSTGFSTRKTPLSKLANYILNKFNTLSLGGAARTVKSAIDAIKSVSDTNATNISTINTKIGSTIMGTTATTLTGAIAEVNDSVSDNTEAISELNSNINTITYFNCTADGSYYTISRQNCYAIGKRIFVSVELVVATASPPTTTGVFIIPSEYRPMSALNGKGFIFRKNGMTIIDLRPALISIDTNGTVKQSLSSNISAGENIVIWAEYMLT